MPTAPRVKAKDRKHRISIMKKTLTPDGMGGNTETRSAFVPPVWAAIWPASAKEVLRNEKIEQVRVIPINIRYIAGITSDMEVDFGSSTYRILGIINHDMACRDLDLLCEEVL